MHRVTRRSAGDASRLNRSPAARSSLRFGRNTLGIPPSRALSAGRLAGLGAHVTLSTGRSASSASHPCSTSTWKSVTSRAVFAAAAPGPDGGAPRDGWAGCQETRTSTQLGDTNFYALVFLDRRAASGRGAVRRRERSDRSYAAPRLEASAGHGRVLTGLRASGIPSDPARPSHACSSEGLPSFAGGCRRSWSSLSR